MNIFSRKKCVHCGHPLRWDDMRHTWVSREDGSWRCMKSYNDIHMIEF